MEGLWNFDNDFTRNVIIFGVDNSSSSHTNNPKNNFLMLDEVPSDGINDSVGAAGKIFSIRFHKSNIKFCLRLHYNGH